MSKEELAQLLFQAGERFWLTEGGMSRPTRSWQQAPAIERSYFEKLAEEVLQRNHLQRR